MNKYLGSFLLIIFVAFAVLFGGCKKNLGNQVSINNVQTKDGFPNQPFDWENSMVMMPTVTNDPAHNPSLPWSSQSGSYVDPNIISDYKSSDGWVLVYNTFNPTYYLSNLANGGLYFALYNKYRGLLRYYLYVPSGQFGGGAEIQHGLSVYGNYSTSMLNFEGSDIVNPNPANDVTAFTKTNNGRLESRQIVDRTCWRRENASSGSARSSTGMSE